MCLVQKFCVFPRFYLHKGLDVFYVACKLFENAWVEGIPSDIGVCGIRFKETMHMTKADFIDQVVKASAEANLSKKAAGALIDDIFAR